MLSWIAPLALGIAMAPLDGPLPACVLAWALVWAGAQLWHRLVMPRWRRRKDLAEPDLTSLGWHVLSWIPVGGLFLAFALVLRSRLSARLHQGLNRPEALADITLSLVPMLVVTLLGQWGLLGALNVYLASTL